MQGITEVPEYSAIENWTRGTQFSYISNEDPITTKIVGVIIVEVHCLMLYFKFPFGRKKPTAGIFNSAKLLTQNIQEALRPLYWIGTRNTPVNVRVKFTMKH